MIVLDTNVISELMRGEPEARVLHWVDAYPRAEIFTTAVTVAELAHGLARLPDGNRKTLLGDRIAAVVDEGFRGRVLPFDAMAAGYYGEIVASREREGRPITTADAQIAAVCRRFTACLATRNTKDFTGTGIALRDPWGAAG